MRERKNLVCILLVALIASMTLVGLSTASPETVVYVDPSLSSAAPGETFDIYVTASDVVDLFLAEFYLSWDPPLLYTDVDSINVGDIAPFMEFMIIEEVNNAEGWLQVTVGRPIGVKEGLSGTVQLAKITFLVEGEGSCALHISDDRLLDTDGIDMLHTTEDGYFTNVYLTLWIRKHGGRIYPEWHSGTVGQLQTLYAKIVNTGTSGAYVRVNFTIYTSTDEVYLLSNELSTEPGGRVTVSAEFTPTIAGTHFVKGVLQFSFDGAEWTNYQEVQETFGGEGVSRDPATKFSAS